MLMAMHGHTKGILMAIMAMIRAIMAMIRAIMAIHNGNNTGHTWQYSWP